RDVERRPGALFRIWVEAAEERLDRAVEKLGRQHHADGEDQKAPFLDTAAQGDPGDGDEDGKEEMNGEAAVAADTELEPAQSVAELLAPGPARALLGRRRFSRQEGNCQGSSASRA